MEKGSQERMERAATELPPTTHQRTKVLGIPSLRLHPPLFCYQPLPALQAPTMFNFPSTFYLEARWNRSTPFYVHPDDGSPPNSATGKTFYETFEDQISKTTGFLRGLQVSDTVSPLLRLTGSCGGKERGAGILTI